MKAAVVVNGKLVPIVSPQAKTYVGKVCDKHPELEGLRLQKNYLCVACRREYRAANRKPQPTRAERQEAKRRKEENG